MKKGTGFLAILLVLACMAGLAYIMMFGLDKNGNGATENTKLGLDLAGGVSITYEIVGDEAPTKEDVDDTIMKLRKRIDKFSTESNIFKEGENRICIEIPGVTDAKSVLEELGSPGALYFVKETSPDGSPNYGPVYTASGNAVYKEDMAVFAADTDGQYYEYIVEPGYAEGHFKTNINDEKIPYTVIDNNAVSQFMGIYYTPEELIANGSIILTGTDVTASEAKSYTDEKNTVQHIVSLEFTDAGTQIFAQATAEALGRSIGIYYDGEIVSAPVVQAVITNGNAQITGMDDATEAANLAQDIRIGGLKLELNELRSNVVGAQLGNEAIHTSIKAGLIGLAIVVLFMIFIYYIPGLASSIALVLYTMLTLVIINVMEITLTLPGIAGIILSVGMAVDANVIIFARIREEIAAGVNVENAIKAGFSKALSAIIDGNITTLIAAVVLIAMGSGTIKGFAYTLALGIVLSMFTALFVTKLILNAFYAIGFKSPKWYGKAKEHKIVDFVGKRKIYYAISSIIIIAGIATMVIFGVKSGDALNFSLEFKGGSATTVDLGVELPRETVDGEIVTKIEGIINDANVQWTTINDTTQVEFKTKTLTQEQRDSIKAMFVNDYGVDANTISTETISSTISGEMQRQALIAVLISAVCMLIYIWFRFSDFRFGTSAVAALLHDVLVVVTFYAIFRIGVGSTFIACILTIVGYSINATIVIFDRIRENLRSKGKKESLEDVCNKSITQTLSRSLFTSLTTFIMVFVLYILGVSSIKEFALPLMIGIISGTYSSIFLTGSLWNGLRKKFPQTEADD